MAEGVWIVNSSPLVGLAKARVLHVLEELCDELLLPDVVVAEVMSASEGDPARDALAQGWGARVPVVSLRPEVAVLSLDAGEAAVLSVALDHAPSTAIIDDGKGRRAARSLGVPVFGSVGVLLRAKRANLISSAADAVRCLQVAGIYLPDDAVLTQALATVGEQWP